MSYHDKLLRWYLARLRRLAWADDVARQVTPATLVSGDSVAIQQIVQLRAQQQEQSPESTGMVPVSHVVALFILSMAVAMFFSLIFGRS